MPQMYEEKPRLGLLVLPPKRYESRGKLLDVRNRIYLSPTFLEVRDVERKRKAKGFV